ncbi:hypothetical protein [Enterococcus bulliens]
MTEKRITILDMVNAAMAANEKEAELPKDEKIAKRVRNIHQMAHDNFSSEVTIKDFQYDLSNEIECLADLLEIKL